MDIFHPPLEPAVLRSDATGSGWFGAPRGDREHKGIDLEGEPGQYVYAPSTGDIVAVTKAYSDADFKIIKIEDNLGVHELFYCTLRKDDMRHGALHVGRTVEKGQYIADLQDITTRYPDRGMVAHLHWQYRLKGGITGMLQGIFMPGNHKLDQIYINPASFCKIRFS